jgi:hypothetical protein
MPWMKTWNLLLVTSLPACLQQQVQVSMKLFSLREWMKQLMKPWKLLA